MFAVVCLLWSLCRLTHTHRAKQEEVIEGGEVVDGVCEVAEEEEEEEERG